MDYLTIIILSYMSDAFVFNGLKQELQEENKSDPTDANMSDGSSGTNESNAATVDERQVTTSTQISPENNSQLSETTRPDYQVMYNIIKMMLVDYPLNQ